MGEPSRLASFTTSSFHIFSATFFRGVGAAMSSAWQSPHFAPSDLAKSFITLRSFSGSSLASWGGFLRSIPIAVTSATIVEATYGFIGPANAADGVADGTALADGITDALGTSAELDPDPAGG